MTKRYTIKVTEPSIRCVTVQFLSDKPMEDVLATALDYAMDRVWDCESDGVHSYEVLNVEET